MRLSATTLVPLCGTDFAAIPPRCDTSGGLLAHPRCVDSVQSSRVSSTAPGDCVVAPSVVG